MPSFYDNRKENLKRLINEHNGEDGRGGASVVAKRSGVSSSTISQIILESEVQPATYEKRRPGAIHQMGDTVARKIERAFWMDEGDMDRPEPSAASRALTSVQRDLLATLEALMLAGCISDQESAAEKSRLLHTYPSSSNRPKVHTLVLGNTPFMKAQ